MDLSDLALMNPCTALAKQAFWIWMYQTGRTREESQRENDGELFITAKGGNVLCMKLLGLLGNPLIQMV